MPLLISDANIFIDFEEAGLLEALFRLPETIGVPDLLFEDELRERHEDLLDHGLALLELRAPAVKRVVELAKLYRKPSRLDLAALALAEQEGCPLLSGDRHLREAAEAERVDVHGTLWLAERLVREKLVSLSELTRGYARMKDAGRRLPWDAVDQQLARLRAELRRQ